MCTEVEYLIDEINKRMKTHEQVNAETNNGELFIQIKKDFLVKYPDKEQEFLKYTESPKITIALIKKIRNIEDINKIIIPISFSVSFTEELSKNINLDEFTIRHYTKFDPKSFGGKIKSNLTLTAKGNKPLTRSSGHTTGADWNLFGNVGDTFYSLFRNGKLASNNSIPSFIKDATFYIEWSLKDFGECWASGDWLSCIINEPKKPASLPIPPLSYSGSANDVVLASLLCNPLQTDEKAALKEIKETLQKGIPQTIDDDSPIPFLKFVTNFEIKKHGSMSFNRYFDINKNTWVEYKDSLKCWEYYDNDLKSNVQWYTNKNFWEYYNSDLNLRAGWNPKNKRWESFDDSISEILWDTENNCWKATINPQNYYSVQEKRWIPIC